MFSRAFLRPSITRSVRTYTTTTSPPKHDPKNLYIAVGSVVGLAGLYYLATSDPQVKSEVKEAGNKVAGK